MTTHAGRKMQAITFFRLKSTGNPLRTLKRLGLFFLVALMAKSAYFPFLSDLAQERWKSQRNSALESFYCVFAWWKSFRPIRALQGFVMKDRGSRPLLPDGRRPPGPGCIGCWGMGDELWRGQKRGIGCFRIGRWIAPSLVGFEPEIIASVFNP